MALLELPEDLRAELKEPLGRVYTDADALLAAASEPLVAVGDVVTYHLLTAGYRPAVAVVDGKTERERVDREVRAAIDGFDRAVEVENPAATVAEGALDALRGALDHGGTTLIEVDGEEDLLALPAVLAVPEGASVVYGQPGEGMVLATADDGTRERVRSLLTRFDGDHERAFAALA